MFLATRWHQKSEFKTQNTRISRRLEANVVAQGSPYTTSKKQTASRGFARSIATLFLFPYIPYATPVVPNRNFADAGARAAPPLPNVRQINCVFRPSKLGGVPKTEVQN